MDRPAEIDDLARGLSPADRRRPSAPLQSGRPSASGRSARVRTLARTLVGMIALGIVWRFARFGACPPMWGDEAFIAVNLLVRDFAGLLRPLEYYQIAPVGFLWAELAVVRALGPSEWAIRLIPFLSGLAALGLFVRFARKTVDRRSALMAVGIFAASFYPVRHATEVKPYSTDLLFSMMATILAWSIWLDRDSIRRWLALTTLIAAGVWFSYPLVFVAAGVGTVLAVRVGTNPDRRALALYVGFGLTISTSWVLSYLTFGRTQAEAAPFYTELETWRDAFPPLSQPWLLPYWLLDTHTGNMLAYPNGGKNFASLGTAIAVAAGCWTLRKTRPAFLAMLLEPPGAHPDRGLRLHRYPYGTSARTTLYMAPAFCLLAGVGLVALIRRSGVRPSTSGLSRGLGGVCRDDAGRDRGERGAAVQELRGRREPPGGRRPGPARPAGRPVDRLQRGRGLARPPGYLDARALAPADGRGPLQHPGQGPGAG